MAWQRFEVGDKVFYRSENEYGEIINVQTKTLPNDPTGESEMRLYDIRLENGHLLRSVYSGIEPDERGRS